MNDQVSDVVYLYYKQTYERLGKVGDHQIATLQADVHVCADSGLAEG